jgi:hypothetical protein
METRTDNGQQVPGAINGPELPKKGPNKSQKGSQINPKKGQKKHRKFGPKEGQKWRK